MPVLIPNPGPDPFIDLAITEHGDDQMRLILPSAAIGVQAENFRRLVEGRLGEKELELIRANKLDPAAVFQLGDFIGSMRLAIPPGETMRLGLSVTRTDKPARVSVMSSQNGTVLGGSTFIFRAPRK